MPLAGKGIASQWSVGKWWVRVDSKLQVSHEGVYGMGESNVRRAEQERDWTCARHIF